ncbi:chemotaxis protein CheD [Paludicola sp. MB14-C6]|uniref:chemotaxis protein CheD n=1 Tax=Paludihabitans sp. MB14-C6 TaxID=3070656 RepID=UPI0027DC856F|nr:chemotaxis protein CheD [Paludicola sp. MB14-C6]WMJ24226.1 chemotaxis protein CheD [Paludicola sp. MB14-C6]
MSEIITIGISDMNITTAPNTLVTFALGSCIGICLYEPILKIGALGHIMLPNCPDIKNEKNVNKYADTCIPHMLEKLQGYQCQKTRLKAKIVGGAKMFEVSGDSSFGNIGARNIEAVKKVLQENRIQLYAEDTGLNFGRTVYFHVDTGAVEVKSFNRETKIL